MKSDPIEIVIIAGMTIFLLSIFGNHLAFIETHEIEVIKNKTLTDSVHELETNFKNFTLLYADCSENSSYKEVIALRTELEDEQSSYISLFIIFIFCLTIILYLSLIIWFSKKQIRRLNEQLKRETTKK